MGHIVASVNMKGGVGKTTLSVNLAACLAKFHRKRVLLVDLDTQISATLSMLPPSEFAKLRKQKLTLRQLVSQAIHPGDRKTPIQEAIRPNVCHIQGLDLLPGDIELYDEYLVSEHIYNETLRGAGSQGAKSQGAESQGAESLNFDLVWTNFEKRLVKSILEPVVNAYDFIILDCAPGYNLLTRSSIIASNFYLLPARPEPLSVIGIQLLERRIEKLKEVYQADKTVGIKLLGIVFTMSGVLTLSRYYSQVMKRVGADFNSNSIFNTRIPSDVSIPKSVDSFTPVIMAHPSSSASKAFVNLTQEFLLKLQMSLGKKDQTSKMSLVDLE